MQRRFVTVDVFTDRPFGGNPLAVVLDAQGLSPAQMQRIAREFNYAETTFVLPPENPAHTALVRIFTPVNELPFAGHPNVGTAFALAREGVEGDSLAFEEAAGLVRLTLFRRAGTVTGAELTAPQGLRLGETVAAATVASCAGLAETDIRTELHAPVVASVGLPFIVSELASLDALSRAVPDVGAFRGRMPIDGAEALFLHVADPADPEVQHARMFAPLDGILEDPATGSAAAACAGLLAALRPEQDGAFQLCLRQGEAMGRPSLLRTSVEKRAGQVAQIRIGGACAPMFTGTIDLAGEA